VKQLEHDYVHFTAVTIISFFCLFATFYAYCASPIASSSSLQLGLCSSHTAKYVKHTARTKLGEWAFSLECSSC